MSPRVRPFGFCVWLLAAASLASAQSPLRRPLGVYAKVDLKDAINNVCPQKSDAKQHACLQNFYQGLLRTPPVAGLTVGLHWDQISTSEQLSIPGDYYAFAGYDWSWVDDVFAAVAAVGYHQTVQFIITPGFDTPLWFLKSTTIQSCDPLLTGPAPVPGSTPLKCDKVTFKGYPEEKHSDGKELPLPWSDDYQEKWLGFLGDFQQRYFFNHPEWVSLMVAGPSGASPELILPADENDKKPQVGGLTVTEVWTRLLVNSFCSGVACEEGYLGNDEAIVDHFKKVIDKYRALFGTQGTTSSLALVLSPDAGNYFPNFNNTPPHLNPFYSADCADTQAELSCEAKTDILHYFVENGGVGNVARVGGLKASSPLQTGDIGLPAVKLLTPPQPAPFFGGAEFDHPVSGHQIQLVGCPSKQETCSLTPEEAAYNLLAVFFNQTPKYVYDYWSVNLKHSPRPPVQVGESGGSLMQYLEVPYLDLVYAQQNPCGSDSKDFENTANPLLKRNTSLTDLLNQASLDLFAMAGYTLFRPIATCTNGQNNH